MTPLLEGGVVGDIRGKTRLPATFCPLEKAKAPLLEGGTYLQNLKPFSATPTQPAQTFTYARMHASSFNPLSLLSPATGRVSPSCGLGCRGWPRVAGPRRGCPVWPGYTVAVAVWWPPPSLEAGSGRLGLRDPGGESPPPWILLAFAIPSELHTP
jgi:hypothetical protein